MDRKDKMEISHNNLFGGGLCLAVLELVLEIALSPTPWAHWAVHSVHCDQSGTRTACGIVIMTDKVRQIGVLTSTWHRRSVIWIREVVIVLAQRIPVRFRVGPRASRKTYPGWAETSQHGVLPLLAMCFTF